jgi:uncharacterized protein (DUF58 family)
MAGIGVEPQFRTGPVAGLKQLFNRRVANWAHKRQGTDHNPFTLNQRRIYILPTRSGLAFAGLVFAMLLGSLNYAASLGFALTFLLCGVGLVCMHHAHRNLLGVEVRFHGVKPVFAGDTAQFQIGFKNAANNNRYELELFHQGIRSAPHDVPDHGDALASLAVPTEARGLLTLNRFGIATRHPAGLFRAWSWGHLPLQCVVYPQPAPPGRPLPSQLAAGSDQWSEERGEADFAGLRAFSPGDPPRRIAWKAYARSGDLLIKQFSGSQVSPLLLDWDGLAGETVEARLSQLTRWCLDADQQGSQFGLKLPGQIINPSAGAAHLNQCLTALALFDGRDDSF